MQLIRIGHNQGINLEFVVSWEVETDEPDQAPAPDPAETTTQDAASTYEPRSSNEDAPQAAEPPVMTTETAQTSQVAPGPAAPAPPPTVPTARRLTLTLASAGAVQTLTFEGKEAEALRGYLNGRSGALVR